MAPRQLAVLGLLCSISPASIDIYLPAFGAIAADFSQPAAAIHRTLGLYMLAYACMLPLHGALADSCGRKRVIIVALGCYLGASLLCAFAPSFDYLLLGRLLQGAAAGACSVVAPAMIQDSRHEASEASAQRAMSTLILILNLSPAIAPIVGGYLTTALGWRANFAMLALMAALACYLCARYLHETLPVAQRQALDLRPLLGNFARLIRQRQIIALCLAGALPVAGQGLIIGSAPDLLLHVLHWQATDFGYLFMPMVAGAMAGAMLALRIGKRGVLVTAFGCMGGGGLALTLAAPDAPVAVILPLALYVCGLAMATPSLTLRLMAAAPQHCGAAASLSGMAQLLMFALASGWLAPQLATRPAWLGVALLVCTALSVLAWGASHQRAPLPT
jgi:DHA1 family bicyclomycin/chloramphenicol resistance-like MFS transporter